jgi:hypothetical protein
MTKFMERVISKRTLCLGIAGQIEHGAEDLPPRAMVDFSARAIVSKISHKFLADGTIEEMTVLTIDKETFEVLEVERALEQAELPLTATQPSGPVTAEETEAVTAAMGVRNADGSPLEPPPLAGPLLVSCEACGHGKGDHEGEEHEGKCLHPTCACEQYVPFAEPPPEEELEEFGVDEGNTAAEADAEGVPA